MRRLVFLTLLGLAAYYAVFGGEYSLLEVWGIRLETDQAQVTLDRLNAETDSLALRAQVLENDAETLETLARERFGMIRDGEVLYRFADEPSSPQVGEEQGGTR